MKWTVVAVVSAITVFGMMKANVHNKTGATELRPPYTHFAVLELFTSEGCSSCPPADRLLPQLGALAPGVIPLSFHVDYWDNLGWKDPFSKSEFSDRQREYGQLFKLESIYTPQLIINGQYEMVGSNRSFAEQYIKKVLQEESPVSLEIDQVKKDGNKLFVTCHLQGTWQNSDLLAAVVQKHAESDVKGGENHGSKLVHTNVVRTFLHLPAKEKMNFEMKMPDLEANNWQLIIYTRQTKDLKITGVALYEP